MLRVISTLDPGHEYFSKGYNPPKECREPEVEEGDLFFDNSNHYLDGLPMLGRLTRGRAHLVSYDKIKEKANIDRYKTVMEKRSKLKMQMRNLGKKLPDWYVDELAE